MVVHGDEIDEKFRAADDGGDDEGRDEHLADPAFAAHASVQTAAKVAVDGRRCCVHKYGCSD